MAESDKPNPDHNPVYFSLPGLGKLTTFNVKNVTESLLKSTLESIKPDILFLQELRTPEVVENLNLRNDFHFRYTHESINNSYNAVLARKSVFEMEEDEIDESLMSSSLDESSETTPQDILPRKCSVLLRKIVNGNRVSVVAISWHGRSRKRNKNGEKKMDKKRKLEHLDMLQTFAKDKAEKYEASVIIGGDFNINSKKLPAKNDFILKSPEKTIQFRENKRNLDYFMYLPLQQLKAKVLPFELNMEDQIWYGGENVQEESEESDSTEEEAEEEEDLFGIRLQQDSV